MVQTAAGASNNAWIQYQKECAKRYKEEKSSTKSAGDATSGSKGQAKAPATAHSKARGKAASPTKAQKTNEVQIEERREKAKATKLNQAATKQLKAHAKAGEQHKKAADAPRKAAAKQRLAEVAQKTHQSTHSDAIARAHETVRTRRREKGKP